MKYVKLTVKPDTWFKAGTQVYDYDYPYKAEQLITLDYWEQCVKDGGVCVVGIRVIQEEHEIRRGYKVGQEIEDGEYCDIDEFEVEIIYR